MELSIRRLFERGWVGAILVEPIQGRVAASMFRRRNSCPSCDGFAINTVRC